MKRLVTLPFLFAATLGLSALSVHCSDDTSGDAPDSGPQLTQPIPTIALTDAEIAGILAAANNGEITEGTLATTHAHATTVHTFATNLVSSHTQQDARQHTLLTALALTPAASATSDQIAATVAETMKTLNGLSGDAFDKAYVKAQVDLLTAYIELLADSMIPSSKNEDLLGELEQTRITVGDELVDAQALNVLLNPYDAGAVDAGDASDVADASNAGDANDAGIDASAPPSDAAIDASPSADATSDGE